MHMVREDVQTLGGGSGEGQVGPRWEAAAFRVLRISIATVIGPTPPGTGVIHPATRLTCEQT